MSLDCVRECADMARTSDCVQQYRTVQLTIRVLRWSGGKPGLGQLDIVSELVMPKYEVKELSAREVASSGGHFEAGDLRVLDISPPYTKADGLTQGGYTREQLDPKSLWTEPDYDTPTRDRVVEYVLSGEPSGTYRLINLNTDDVTAWSLVLRRSRETP